MAEMQQTLSRTAQGILAAITLATTPSPAQDLNQLQSPVAPVAPVSASQLASTRAMSAFEKVNPVQEVLSAADLRQRTREDRTLLGENEFVAGAVKLPDGTFVAQVANTENTDVILRKWDGDKFVDLKTNPSRLSPDKKDCFLEQVTPEIFIGRKPAGGLELLTVDKLGRLESVERDQVISPVAGGSARSDFRVAHIPDLKTNFNSRDDVGLKAASWQEGGADVIATITLDGKEIIGVDNKTESVQVFNTQFGRRIVFKDKMEEGGAVSVLEINAKGETTTLPVGHGEEFYKKYAQNEANPIIEKMNSGEFDIAKAVERQEYKDFIEQNRETLYNYGNAAKVTDAQVLEIKKGLVSALGLELDDPSKLRICLPTVSHSAIFTDNLILEVAPGKRIEVPVPTLKSR